MSPYVVYRSRVNLIKAVQMLCSMFQPLLSFQQVSSPQSLWNPCLFFRSDLGVNSLTGSELPVQLVIVLELPSMDVLVMR